MFEQEKYKSCEMNAFIRQKTGNNFTKPFFKIIISTIQSHLQRLLF